MRTVDTDSVVILIDMQLHYPEIELWIFGIGKHFHYNHVNYICMKLGEDISKSLTVLCLF